MLEPSTTTLQGNFDLLKSISPNSDFSLEKYNLKPIDFKKNNLDTDIDLYIGVEKILESLTTTLSSEFDRQLVQTDGISLPRIARPDLKNDSTGNSPESLILSNMVNAHREVLFDYLPAFPVEGEEITSIKPIYKNLTILGSLMLIPLVKYLKTDSICPWVGITIVEDDFSQLNATLSLINLSDLIDLCKSKTMSLVLHLDQDKQNLQDRLYTQVCKSNPTTLYGSQFICSPVKSPTMMELYSWLPAPEHAGQHFISMLGFTTDELNQTQQALWNALQHHPLQVISHDDSLGDTPVVLVASGPSLDDNIDWLKKHANELNIVAAGSALGALLTAGIKPSAVVFLERDSDVYLGLCDLLAVGFDLKGIIALLSSTIDPRVPTLFDNSIFFHRPVSAATCLFPADNPSVLPISGPHVINAALEVLLVCGIKKVLLMGADFSAVDKKKQRSENALGHSIREFNIPVRGSKGRTVFSEDGLLHTGYLLNRMIKTAKDCNVFRAGECFVLDSVREIDAGATLALEFSDNSHKLRNSFLGMPNSSFTKEDCSSLFDLLKNQLSLFESEISTSIYSVDSWNRYLAETLSKYFVRLNDNLSREERFLVQLVSMPLFYASMSLHDASSDDVDSFDHARSNLVASIQLMKTTLNAWSETLASFLSVSRLPQWDPAWLSQYYSKITSRTC